MDYALRGLRLWRGDSVEGCSGALKSTQGRLGEVFCLSILECFKIALSAMGHNKLRSGLTALGVIIGVGAVIAMVSVGEGAKRQISERIRALGANLLIVSPGRMGGSPGGPQGARGTARVLTNDVWQAILPASPSVVRVAPEAATNKTVKSGSRNTVTQVIGTTPDFLGARSYRVEMGRFFTAAEMEGRRRLAVLGMTVVEDLFGSPELALGQSIKIGGIKFDVIGVMEAKGQTGFTNNDDRIYVPLKTLQKRLGQGDWVRSIYVQAKDEKSMTTASQEVTQALLGKLEEDQFFVMNQGEILETAEGTSRTLTFLLAGIAGVSLLVGGIGIMNIMLVSVTERVREIGIRKAIGAKRRDILMQFLTESIVLSSTGGLIGLLAGVGGASAIARVAGWPTAVPGYAVALAFIFSMAVGLFFGVYPASRAAALDPVEALRYE